MSKRAREKNLEKRLAHNRKRRALKNNCEGSHTDKEWNDLCNFFGNKCLDCEAENVKLTRDHIIPLSKGGTDFIENIQPLCGPCNSKKHKGETDFREGSIQSRQL